MSLYLHTRQYASAVQVRQHFLTLRPQIRSSWVGLMVAHHLNGDIPSAIETYEALQSCINVDGGTAPERAQTALYVIRLCIEQGDYENALKRLDTGLSKKVINARGEISHMRGTSRPGSRDHALTHSSRHTAQAGSKRRGKGCFRRPAQTEPRQPHVLPGSTTRGWPRHLFFSLRRAEGRSLEEARRAA